MSELERKLDITLETLKDFQRATVAKIMRDLADSEHSRRILVADEVGLGKTVVARGVIASLLKQHIQRTPSAPMRVTYICSNLTLANENIRKLSVFSDVESARYVQNPSFSRLIELAISPDSAKSDAVLELCSLTPSTSFTLTRGDGNMRERHIIFRCLMRAEPLQNHRTLLEKLMRNGIKKSSWDAQDGGKLNESVYRSFLEKLTQKPTADFINRCPTFSKATEWNQVLFQYCENPYSHRGDEYRLRIELRQLLARCCAANLEADLYILDEFQRFQTLLETDEGNDEALIAQQVFRNQGNAAVLLLSATPFKALSRIDEDETGDAHHTQLTRLLTFLMQNDPAAVATYEQARQTLMQAILELCQPGKRVTDRTRAACTAVEQILSTHISRTERNQARSGTSDYADELISTTNVYSCDAHFKADDIKAFQSLCAVRDGLGTARGMPVRAQLMEFHKAAPWALSFLTGYELRKQMDKHLHNPVLKKALGNSKAGWLCRERISTYKLDLCTHSAHAKTAGLVNSVFEGRSAEMLWAPPTAPDYPLQGCYENSQSFSKTLLFSAWAMAPRALSGLLSYEAERRLIQRGVKADYFSPETTRRIRFDSAGSLQNWLLMYPSSRLADIKLTGFINLNELIQGVKKRLQPSLNALRKWVTKKGKPDKNWYAIASLLLDRENSDRATIETWLDKQYSLAPGTLKPAIEKVQALITECTDKKALTLGPQPADLAEMVALQTIAAPATCLLRMMRTFWPKESDAFVSKANMISSAFVTMFNRPESARAITCGRGKYPHLRNVLNYCAQGGIQAMLNEYGYLLSENGSSLEHSAQQISDVLNMRTGHVNCHFAQDSARKLKESSEKSRLRCHYAMPLGTQTTSDSEGQEGLDFRWYCRRVVHWNLPANPIYIEQREGRVNRFKSLVIRQRIAQQFSMAVKTESTNQWAQMFTEADKETHKQGRTNDLIPHWYMPPAKHAETPPRIERVVLTMPMSRELVRLKELQKVLALYRLAFGQPRQEELIESLALNTSLTDEEIREITINLAPLMASR